MKKYCIANMGRLNSCCCCCYYYVCNEVCSSSQPVLCAADCLVGPVVRPFTSYIYIYIYLSIYIYIYIYIEREREREREREERERERERERGGGGGREGRMDGQLASQTDRQNFIHT